MRRSSLLGVVAALSLAACAGRAPRPGAPGDIRDDGPLDVRLFQPSGRTLSFALSRPAYVAVFEIVPGQGVSLLYPAAYHYAATHQSGSGYNVAQLPLYNLGRTFYLASFSRATPRPIFLYAIASETPLDIDEIMRSPSALRSRIGVRAFAQGFSEQMMERIDEAVVPAQADESWATDYVVLWPEVPESRVMPPSILVVCADGRQIVVDPYVTGRSALAAGCERPRVVTPTPSDSAAGPRTPPAPPSDSGSAAEPKDTPGRPTPRGGTPPAPKKNEAAPARHAPAPPTTLVVDYGTPRAATAKDSPRRGPSWAERESARWRDIPSTSGRHRDGSARAGYADGSPAGSSPTGSRPMHGAASAPRGDAGPAAPGPRSEPAPRRDPSPAVNGSRADSPRAGATRRAQ